MSFSTQTFRGSASLNPATTPKITNLVSPLTADTEFQYVFTDNTKKYLIRCRESAKLKFSFVAGDSGNVFITIPNHASYEEFNINLTGVTIYMQVNKPNVTIEVLEWT